MIAKGIINRGTFNRTIFLFLLPITIASIVAFADEPAERRLSDVGVDQKAFDPSHGQTLNLSYYPGQAHSGRDPDLRPGRRFDPNLGRGADQAAGHAQHAWDGRDDTGQIIPDEAYTFVIETADGAVYDPTTFSGGAVGDLTDVGFDASGTVSSRHRPAS